MFQDKLKQKREELSLSQEQLGELINAEISRQSISKWESGESYPTVDKLLILAAKLNLSLDELFEEELAYLRKEKTLDPHFAEKYPGIIAAVNTFYDAIKDM